jgi:hypothetical protein
MALDRIWATLTPARSQMPASAENKLRIIFSFFVNKGTHIGAEILTTTLAARVEACFALRPVFTFPVLGIFQPQLNVRPMRAARQ